ncbi:helix-turn-helix transcriptional regulator [Paraburkholderia sp.]|uniref:AraC family transcriptional regulator n=1 Tax=Paraburkholderia sp. TaxID=1926495 RepID=UPI0026229C8E|nr:helix-turn-helix transcriptional regulator [Paraburkholderia sp.]
MPRETPSLIGPPPAPISFRIVDFPAGTIFPAQRAAWGKLLYAVNGVVDFTIANERYLSPPAYAIWIPPRVAHDSRTLHDIRYASVYVRRELCRGLPETPCTLRLSALVKAIVADFAARNLAGPVSVADRRLAQVLLDQLRLAKRHENYLPTTDDPLLAPVLTSLRSLPGDRRSLAAWAATVNTTERTFARRCRLQLGISFGEWRQRLKLVTAFALLDAGHPVQRIASELGYNSTSAFIAMFHQLTGMSPTETRNHRRG